MFYGISLCQINWAVMLGFLLFFVVSPGGDHRFTATWHPLLDMRSLSRNFDKTSKESVKAKLEVVHTYAWKAWKDNLSSKRAYQLDSSEDQVGGKIPGRVLDEVYQYISTLPEKKKQKRGK